MAMTHDEFEASAKQFCDEFNARLAEIAMQRLTGVQQEIDATIKDNLTVEPVAYVTGYSKGYATVRPVDPCLLMPVGMALYRSPFKRKPLMDEERAFLVTRHSSFNRDYVKGEVVVTWVCDGDALIRAVERAHGIGGEG